MTFVYLDVETTGLDPSRHQVWEMAYAVDGSPIFDNVVVHTLINAEDEALNISRYAERAHVTDFDESLSFEIDVITSLRDRTIVGANPAFDAAFLRARWGQAPWKYRLLDIEAYAMGALDLSAPKGLKEIAERLHHRGFDIPQPDHTAAGDVATVRACHHALRRIYEGGVR